jgi:cell division septal protein FtsQ
MGCRGRTPLWMSRLKLAGVVAALAALYGGWLLLRDAPFFAVQKVTITGVESPPIRATLTSAARGMTTTHFDVGRLRAAVASFALVKTVAAQTEFPHGLRVEVTLERPVAALVVAGERLAVSPDGRIVRGLTAPAAAPVVLIANVPLGARITDPLSVDAIELLDVAPRALRARVATVTNGTHGLTVTLRAGPALYFGDTTRLHAKWSAAARVLADPGSRGAAYIDLHVPDRPAAQVGDPLTTGAATTAPGTAGGPLITAAPAAPEG